MKFFTKKHEMECRLLYKNHLVDNIYAACTCCYDNSKPIPYLEKKEYIGKRINAGHDSVLEHGRLAIIINNIPFSIYENMIELMGMEYCKWLEFYTAQMENGDYNLIVNGTIRGYKQLLNNLSGDEYDRNILIRNIVNILQENTVKEFYGTNKYLEIADFIDIEPDEEDPDAATSNINYSYVNSKTINLPITKEDKVKMITLGLDDDPLIDNYINIERLIIFSGFSTDIIERVLAVTVVFYNMSRTATHQLVRHRNAITQESQRYVSADDASFTIPVNEYNDKKFSVSLFGKTETVTLTELANELMGIYSQLKSQGLKKEEARSFLPSNVNCGRLYMTFSMDNLIKFLDLRTDPHAQYEIRQYALAVKSIIDKYNQSNKSEEKKEDKDEV